MDHFMEEVVVKHNRTFDDILYVLSWIMLVIFGLFGLLMLQSLLYQFSVPALIETVIFIGGAVLLFLFKDRLKTEPWVRRIASGFNPRDTAILAI